MKLRILESEWLPFVDELCARTDVESAGIILAERLHGGSVLLARHLSVLPDAAYAIRQRDRIRIDPVAFNRLVRPARDQGFSVLTVHTHPETDIPWFSAADDAGDSVLMPSLFTQMPGPHGSIVVAGNTRAVCARTWTTSGTVMPADLHVVGQALRVMSPDNMHGEEEWFDRQRLALGVSGQQILRDLHVAVIGLGGTGSATFTQLVHLGVGQITIIDGDCVESTNVSRIFGASTTDANVTWKVDVAARYAKTVGLETKVNVLRGHLGREINPQVIACCDVVFSCVDAHLPRSLLNRLSYEKAILLFDMGSAFRVQEDSVIAGSGRVVVIGPGRPCLACWGHIDANRIRIESLPNDERIRQAAEGYVSGADVSQPSVVAFNTMISGAAVIEFLRAVTEFSGADDPPLRLGFDFKTGTVRRNRLFDVSGCKICKCKLASRKHSD
ncbi:MAG: ThiF family adenylyltransferase [Burkholderiaceae bacterium]